MQTVRVFVSSTFSDFLEERKILHREVFPRVAELCRQHEMEFQPVDLRWGITEKDSRDYATLGICLNEIRRCSRVTPRPNFIFLAGERYGWLPVPQKIPGGLFGHLLAGTEDPEDRRILTEAYRQDLNSAAEEYVFTHFPEGGSEERVRRILREAVKVEENKKRGLFRRKWKLSGEERELLFASATHRELLTRLKLDDLDGAAVCAVKTLKNVPEAQRDVYYDVLSDGEIDPEAHEAAAEVRRTIKKICPDAYCWEADLTAGTRAVPDDFADYMYRKIEAHILRELEKVEDRFYADEVSYHRDDMTEKANMFGGRTKELAEAVERVRRGRTKALVITGDATCGLSAFTAKTAAEVLKGGKSVFYRSAGLTGSSSNIRNVEEAFAREKADVIVIDGVEKAHNPVPYLRGILKLAEQADCLVVSMNNTFFREAEDLLADSSRIELPGLTRRDLSEIIDLNLARSGRRLTAEQKECLIGAYESTRNMHVFHLLLGEALGWRSFDPADTSAAGIRDLIESVGRSDPHLPEVLARSLKGYLLAARDGLGNSELLEVLSRDRDVLAEFLRTSRHLLPDAEDLIIAKAAEHGIGESRREVTAWLRETEDLPEVLDAIGTSGKEILLPYAYYSRALYDFMPALGERLSEGQRVYVIENSFKNEMPELKKIPLDMFHGRLADYFAAKDASDSLGRKLRQIFTKARMTGHSRTARELPYQYLKAGRTDELYAFLTDPGWFSFLYRWDRPEFFSLWTELEQRGYSAAKRYEAFLKAAEGPENERPDTASLEALAALFTARGGHPEEVRILQNALVQSASGESRDLKLQAKAQRIQMMLEQEQFEQALHLAEKEMAETPEEDSPGYSALLGAYGVALYRAERYAEAKTVFERGLAAAEKLRNSSHTQDHLKWIASCEKVMGHTAEADKIYERLRVQFEQEENREALIIVNYERAANVFLFGNDPDGAIELLEKAEEQALLLGHRVWLVKIYEMAMSVCCMSRQYSRTPEFAKKYMETWVKVNPGKALPDNNFMDFLISKSFTEPTPETMYMLETCFLMEACGPLPDDAPCVRDSRYGSIMRFLARESMELFSPEFKAVIGCIEPRPEIFAEAFESGLEKYWEGRSEEALKSAEEYMRIFEEACRCVLEGRPQELIKSEDRELAAEAIAKRRVTVGFLLLYLGFPYADRLYEAGDVQGAEYIVQMHAILYSKNDQRLRGQLPVGEYFYRRRLFFREKERFEALRAEVKKMISGESDLVKSIIKNHEQDSAPKK